MSKLTMVRVLAVVLAIALLGFGIPVLHAKDKDSQHGYSSSCPSSCPAPKQVESCPAPKKVESCAPVVVQPEPVCNSCPVDPKKVRKAEKEAEHAQHEAAEACERNQKKIAHYQHEAEEDQARANEHMSKANELASSNYCCKPSEPVAEVQPTEPEPSVAIITPLPEPTPEVTPAPTPEVTLPPPPAPIAEAQPPKELPRTASPMSLIGLIGLLSMSGSLAGFFRRR